MSYKFNPLTAKLDYVIYTNSATIDLTSSGDFTGGEIQVERVGNIVTITNTTAATFTSQSDAASATGLLPEWATPAANKYNPSFFSQSLNYHEEMYATSTGAIGFFFSTFAAAASSRTASSGFGSISYTVAF